jgi:ribosomal protein L34E
MLIWCNNKKCGKNSEATIDKTTGEVYCAECDREIAGVSSFTKATLKSLGQVKQSVKEAYSMKCASCKNEQLPGLNADGKFVCRKCQKEILVGKTFEPLVRKAIKEKENGSK